MNKKKLKEYQKYEDESRIVGWDFSYLKGIVVDEDLPWSYKDIVLKYLKPTDILLDEGTAGGEFLLTLLHPYNQTYVTEGYEPNYELCCKRLIPLGINVNFLTGDSNSNFLDNTFDIVINRHESYNIKDIKRILKPNGLFITQQVGSQNNKALRESLGYNSNWNSFCLNDEIEKFKSKGFEVIYQNEAKPFNRFLTINAVIYMAKIIEWEFPNFSVLDKHLNLEEIDNKIKDKGYFESFYHRFIMVLKNIK